MRKRVLTLILVFCLTITFILTACGNDPHTHSWSTTYSKDSSHHWLTCAGCDEIKDKEIHTITSKTCSVCGYVQGEESGPSVPTVANVRDLEVISTIAGVGTATLVKLPDGKDMLIDAGDGSTDSVFYLHSLIDEHVSDMTIEYLVLTNTDQLRAGGIAEIFYNYTVLNFYKPDVKSSNSIAANLSSQYNSGNSPIMASGEDYAVALTAAAAETGCSVKVIDDTSCDISYSFFDTKNNSHSYKIDFMMPIAVENRNTVYKNSAMISVEYKGVTTLITSDVVNDLIDAYCNVYGTQKDVDVLINSYSTGAPYAISRSDLRGTNFLEKISLTEGDYSILLSYDTENIDELVKELKDTGAEYYTTLDYYTITAKVTANGVLTVTAE